MSATRFKVRLWEIFVWNEVAKVTDDSLKTIIRKEYPNSQLDIPLGNHSSRLSVWRSEYNRGLLPSPPPCMSFAYNQWQLPCNHFGHTLSKDVVQARLEQFNNRFKEDKHVGVESEGTRSDPDR